MNTRDLVRAASFAGLISCATLIPDQVGGQQQQTPPPPGLPTGTVLSSQSTAERQRIIEDFVRNIAESSAIDLGDRLKAVTLGVMNSDASAAVVRWSVAEWHWEEERPVQAGAFLALGVLVDCLGRLQVVRTPMVRSEESRPFWPDQSAARPGVAAKDFDKALKIDPSLVEARFRAARIRAPKDERAAAALVKLATDPAEPPYGYLATVSRAEVARGRDDLAGAQRWYERARELEPRSTAAAIGLASLKVPVKLDFDNLDADDVYYTYPCTVLTPEVSRELETRILKVVLK
jgi:hypothetical protein